MQFPQRDLTYQYISASYQSAVQTYTLDSESYLLDGYGNVLLSIPSSSMGNSIVTQDQTASYASISTLSLVADVALIADTSSISISSSYSIQSDTASFSVSASWSPPSQTFISSSYSVTASYSVSSSWTPASHIEKGIISGSNFTGLPLIYNIIYDNEYSDSIYTISIIGEDARIWTANNRTTAGFVINSNSNQLIPGMVMWRVEEI